MLKIKFLPTFILIFLFAFSHHIRARILDVPTVQYPTIQAAIDSAVTGDTVLVQPGTYPENISYLGKSITVASLYLTTGETTHIGQTIIDGSANDRVVTFDNSEDSLTVLCGFTIQNGRPSSGGGGGVYCTAGAKPILKNLIITNNSAGAGNGGGIFCFQASPWIEECTIENNSAQNRGGGIYAIQKSEPRIISSVIRINVANDYGGGVYLDDSARVDLQNVSISENTSFSGAGICLRRGSFATCDSSAIFDNFAEIEGGGVFCFGSYVYAFNSNIYDNEGYSGGGGIFADRESIVRLVNTEVTRNRTAFKGGGILAEDSEIILRHATMRRNGAGLNGGAVYSDLAVIDFATDSLSNIYANFSGFDGSDIYFTTSDPISVELDTFSVADPSDYFVYPLENVTLTFNQTKIAQANSDLYVDLTGNNNNDGLTLDNPLRSISYALLKIIGDSLNPHTIYIGDGVYSPSSNEEFLPLRIPPYISLKGFSTAGTVLDGEFRDRIIVGRNNHASTLENLTITGGFSDYIIGSAIDGFGSGIYLNAADVTISNTLITDNFGIFGSAVYCENGSMPLLINVTVANNRINTDYIGTPLAGGIYSVDSDPVIVNSIFWENGEEEISLNQSIGTNSLIVVHSDIQDSVSGIFSSPTDSIYWLAGNISSDPIFTDTTVDNFTLQEGSPCIDAGIDDTFFTYNDNADTLYVPVLVFLGSAPDMGAFESVPSSIASEDNDLPDSYRLYQNFPNPFNPVTTIRFTIPVASRVTLDIYNTAGQRVQTLVGETKTPGTYEVEFNGDRYASGLYFYRLKAGTFRKTGRMVLLK